MGCIVTIICACGRVFRWPHLFDRGVSKKGRAGSSCGEGGAGPCFSRCHVGGVFLSFLCCVLPALRLLLLLFLLLPLLLLFAFALAVFALSGDEVR